MRVTQNMMTRNYLRNMNSNLSRLAKSEDRMIGSKYRKSSENVADTSRALRVRQELTDNEQYATNIRDVAARLSSAESNINSINEILVQSREILMMKGLNDPNAAQRENIAKQIDAMREEILQFANAQFGNNYMFGGTENGKAPFAMGEDGRLTYHDIPVDEVYRDADGRYVYDDENGDTQYVPESTTQYVDIGLGLVMEGSQVEAKSAFPITFSGLDILGIGMNDDGTSGNVVNLLLDTSAMLREEHIDRNMLEKISNRLKDQTEGLRLNLVELGTKTSLLDKTTEHLENDELNLKALQKKLEETDMAEESINWKVYNSLMMATYQFGSQVLPVSLMDFIK